MFLLPPLDNLHVVLEHMDIDTKVFVVGGGGGNRPAVTIQLCSYCHEVGCTMILYSPWTIVQ